jgi:hypothetical protein
MRSGTPKAPVTCTTAARRRAALRSFPRQLPSGSASPTSDQRPPGADAHSPAPATSGASPDPASGRHTQTANDSRLPPSPRSPEPLRHRFTVCRQEKIAAQLGSRRIRCAITLVRYTASWNPKTERCRCLSALAWSRHLALNLWQDGQIRTQAIRRLKNTDAAAKYHYLRGQRRLQVYAKRSETIEAAWSYRFPVRISRELLLRQEGLTKPIRDTAWKAQQRLCQRHRKLARAGEPPTVVMAAIASGPSHCPSRSA